MVNAKHQKARSGKGVQQLNTAAWILFSIEAVVLVAAVLYIIIFLKLLPTKYILALTGISLLLCGLHLLFLLMKGGKKTLRIFSIVLSGIVLLVMFMGVYYAETFRSHIGATFDDDTIVDAPEVNVTNTPFLVYVSGLDQTGVMNDTGSTNEAEVKGRSDVNILIAANPSTKKIVMVHIPRDYYVPLENDPNKMDKLTHAGNYGVECSKKTVDALFGVESNYYLKVNFNSVVEVVDVLGGITVDCKIYPFSSSYSLSGKTYYFQTGENHLTGDSALAYARERYKTGGDGQRGKHQQQVINAILDKVMSPAILNNFGGFFASVSKNFRTNMSYDDMAALVRMQLDDMASWSFDSISVTGTGYHKPCYAAGGAVAYVMEPDWETVQEAVNAINAVMYPETVTTTDPTATTSQNAQ